MSLVQAGLGIYQAVDGGPEPPPPRDLANEYSKSIQAQLDYAPQLRGLNRANTLSNASDQLSAYRAAMFGIPAGPQTQSYTESEIYYRNPQTGETRTTRPTLFDKQNGWELTPQVRQVTKNRTVNVGAQPGLFQTQQDLIRSYGPEFARLIGQIDPYGSELEDQLFQRARADLSPGSLSGDLESDAQRQLGLGASLDPLELADLKNSYNAAAGARGMGYGGGDAVGEALAVRAGGQALREQRQRYALAAQQAGIGTRNFASGVAANRYNTRTAPVLGAVGLGSTANYAQGVSRQPQFDPLNAYSQDLFNTNYNANAAASIAGYNSRQSTLAGAAQGVDSFFRPSINPYYGMNPGDVPYQYSGDPSSLYGPSPFSSIFG